MKALIMVLKALSALLVLVVGLRVLAPWVVNSDLPGLTGMLAATVVVVLTAIAATGFALSALQDFSKGFAAIKEEEDKNA